MKFWGIYILLAAFTLTGQIKLLAQAAPIIPFTELKTEKIKIDERYIDIAVKNLLRRRAQAPDSVIKGLLNLYPICNTLHYTSGKASILMWVGSILILDKKEHVQGLAYIRKAYPYCLQLNKQRPAHLVLWNSNMGAVFTHMGLTDSAMHYYYNGLNIALASENHIQVSHIYYNMGILQYHVKEYRKSIYYKQKAIELAFKEGNKPDLADGYISIANSYLALGVLDTAKKYLQLATGLHLPKDKYNAASLNEKYATLYIKLKQPQNAIPYCEELLASANKKSALYASALKQLGHIYGLLKQYYKSEIYFKEALASYQQSDPEGRDVSLLHDIYQSLSTVNKDMRDYKEAYEYQKRAELVSDSISKIQNIERVNQLETRYRTAEKDNLLTQKELELIKVRNTSNAKNIWLGGISAGLIIAILITIQLVQRSKTKAQQQHVDRLKNLIEGEENERVRIGQQLHDDVMVEFSIVRMNMEVVPTQFPEFGKSKDYINIVQQLNNASTKLRHTAHNLMPDALLEEGLVSALIYFCRNVQQMTGLAIDFQHHGDIPKLAIEREIAIYRVVQELIQNVIKHAAATEVMVQLKYWGKTLNLTVEDNGIGIKDVTTSVKNGRGLNSIRTRLKAINGTMEISPNWPNGLFVDIDINI